MNRESYEKKYKKTSSWFREEKIRLQLFTHIYRTLPLFVIVVYGIVILSTIINGNKGDIFRIITVPFITFLFCTFIRILIDEQRPYEDYNINPLIQKDKRGQSFPSRHVVSAAVIAVAALYVNVSLGIIMLIVCIIIAIIRPIAGVHYVRDVVAGIILGIGCGIIGFYII